MRLEGRVALITGGSTGMGKATALLFAKEGARVAIASRTEKTGKETVEEIRALGGEAYFVPTDVTKASDVRRMIDTTLERYRRINILFNNAGQPFDLPLLELDEKQWDRCFAVNLRSVFLACKFVIPHMQEAGGGVILNNASQVALVGVAGVPAYAAAKAGVLSLRARPRYALSTSPSPTRVGWGSCLIPRTRVLASTGAKSRIPRLTSCWPMGSRR